MRVPFNFCHFKFNPFHTLVCSYVSRYIPHSTQIHWMKSRFITKPIPTLSKVRLIVSILAALLVCHCASFEQLRVDWNLLKASCLNASPLSGAPSANTFSAICLYLSAAWACVRGNSMEHILVYAVDIVKNRQEKSLIGIFLLLRETAFD